MAGRTPNKDETPDQQYVRCDEATVKRELPDAPLFVGVPLAKVARTGSPGRSGVNSRSSASSTGQARGQAAEKRKASHVAVRAAHQTVLDPEAVYQAAVSGELKYCLSNCQKVYELGKS